MIHWPPFKISGTVILAYDFFVFEQHLRAVIAGITFQDFIPSALGSFVRIFRIAKKRPPQINHIRFMGLKDLFGNPGMLHFTAADDGDSHGFFYAFGEVNIGPVRPRIRKDDTACTVKHVVSGCILTRFYLHIVESAATDVNGMGAGVFKPLCYGLGILEGVASCKEFVTVYSADQRVIRPQFTPAPFQDLRPDPDTALKSGFRSFNGRPFPLSRPLKLTARMDLC